MLSPWSDFHASNSPLALLTCSSPHQPRLILLTGTSYCCSPHVTTHCNRSQAGAMHITSHSSAACWAQSSSGMLPASAAVQAALLRRIICLHLCLLFLGLLARIPHLLIRAALAACLLRLCLISIPCHGLAAGRHGGRLARLLAVAAFCRVQGWALGRGRQACDSVLAVPALLGQAKPGWQCSSRDAQQRAPVA